MIQIFSIRKNLPEERQRIAVQLRQRKPRWVENQVDDLHFRSFVIRMDCTRMDDQHIPGGNRNIFPVVLVDRYYENCDLCFMTTNNFQGGINAVNHLLLHGHKKIACIQGVPESMPNIERVSGYKKAMTEAGYNDYIVVTGNEFTIRNGYLSTKLLLRDKDQFSAIFALSNTIMLGALKAVREAGLRVPEDISIISFDDYYYMDFMEPPITRICQPTDEMCNMAVRVLFEKIEKKRDGVTQIRFSPTLKEGKSVYYLK